MRLPVLFVTLFLATLPAWAACPLTVVVEGVENTTGKVGFLVFSSPQGWPQRFEDAALRHAQPATTGRLIWTQDDLEPGRYAIVALHDENENRKLERNFFGLPQEGWGMSNNPSPKLAAPPFESAAFEHNCGTRLSIRLRY